MSMFNIKLKTKNGNDIKHKEIITAYFRTNFSKNVLTKSNFAEFTYRVLYKDVVIDPQVVLEMKNPEKIQGREDLILKTMLNCAYVMTKISDEYNIHPDFLMFISTDFDSAFSGAFPICMNVFEKDRKTGRFLNTLKNYNSNMEENTKLLRALSEANPNTKFMVVNPAKEPRKYAGSIKICDWLDERMNRTFVTNGNNDPEILDF